MVELNIFISLMMLGESPFWFINEEHKGTERLALEQGDERGKKSDICWYLFPGHNVDNICLSRKKKIT